MKSIHEQLAEKASRDLKSNNMGGCDIVSGHYNYKGKQAEQIRIFCATPDSLIKAKEILHYIKWTDLSATTAASGYGMKTNHER